MNEHDYDRQVLVRKRPEIQGPRHHDDARSLQALAAGRTGASDKSAVTRLQRAVGNAGMSSLLAGDEEERSPVHDVVGRGGGQALDSGTRAYMEPRIGADLSGVRVHTDGAASESAKAVQAHAYTVGRDVVFQSGKYDPGSDSGKRMLAHELTHVVQQREGPVDGTPAAGGISVSDPSDRFEQEAERNADRVVSDPAPAPATPAPASAGVQREAATDEDELQGSFVQRQEAPEEEAEETV